VQRLRTGGIPIQLDLVGDGPLRAELEAQVHTAMLQDVVRFHGQVDPARLISLLGTGHVFVTSALSDGNNVSLNEAMACGCYPVATDIPANAQWITPGRNGALFPSGDAGRLAEAIERVAGDEAARRAAALENRRIVEERADWRVSVARMREIYERLAEGRVVR
jgi:glycosyltransferase involved in cell wall biosynthesis